MATLFPTAPQPTRASWPAPGQMQVLPQPPMTRFDVAAPVATPVAPQRPTAPSAALSYAAPVFGGLQAGSGAASAYDTKSGVVGALGAGVAGAASGALSGAAIGAAGGPIGAGAGALIGGGVGLVTGALNAWMSVGRENRANRERRALLQEARSEQKRRDEMAREDALDQRAYQRREYEDSKRTEEWNRMRSVFADARSRAKARSEEYISRGYTT